MLNEKGASEDCLVCNGEGYMKKQKSEIIGRPTDFCESIADLICELMITENVGLKKLCDTHEELPHSSTAKRWLLRHDSFRAKYNIAKDAQADFDADDIKDASGECDYYIDSDGNKRVDSASVARSRNKIEAMKWLAAKRLPRKWGDRQKDDLIEQQREQNAKLSELVDKLSKQYESDI